jgi:hypothetical protein
MPLAAPRVRVLGPIVDEEQHPQCGNALHEAVEDRLGLRVDPVEVFEHEQERLDPRLAHERAPGRLERRLPPLRGIEALPSRIVHGHVEQREQRRQRGLERAVERHDLAEHLLADVPMRIALTDPEVRPERDR